MYSTVPSGTCTVRCSKSVEYGHSTVVLLRSYLDRGPSRWSSQETACHTQDTTHSPTVNFPLFPTLKSRVYYGRDTCIRPRSKPSPVFSLSAVFPISPIRNIIFHKYCSLFFLAWRRLWQFGTFPSDARSLDEPPCEAESCGGVSHFAFLCVCVCVCAFLCVCVCVCVSWC